MKTKFIILFFLLPLTVLGQRAETGTFLVKPYLQYGTQTSMYVLWETSSGASTKVEYGEARLSATDLTLTESVEVPGDRLLHEVQLENLKVQTQYFWRVRSTFADGQELVSPVYTFRTAVKDSSAYMFALIGDTQYNSRTPWAWGKIAKLVWQDRPSFVVHAGDLVDIGTKKTDWTQHFFPNGHAVMSRFPMYTVLGNHEQDAQLYYDYMVNPEPEYYYTFRYGNAQFFMIDTNKEVGEGSEQYDWLEWELAKSTATWKFVIHHHPPYSSEENDHGDTYKGESSYGTHARNLVPLYETYGVDFCLFGHTHVYERTWPIFKDLVNQQEGVIYINSGGAGGGLEGFAPTRSWFSLEMQLVHHYCTFAIFDKTMVFKAIDHEGRVFDSFEMEKSPDRLKRAEMIRPPAPHIFFDKQIFQDQTTIRMEALYPSDKIYYTLDSSEPSLQSQVYTQPLVLTESASLNARVYNANGQASRVVSRYFEQMDPLPPQNPGQLKPGLNFSYYEGSWAEMPNFDELEPIRTGFTTTISAKIFQAREDHWAGVIEGFVEVPETKTYKFFTNSDDGSVLFIDGRQVVDNSGNHGPRDRFGEIPLEGGLHHIRIEYFEYYGGEHLSVGLFDDLLEKKPFRPTQLGRN